MKYLNESKSFFFEKGSPELYFTIEGILEKKLMSFCEMMFRFSQGIGVVSGESSGILLDEDWDAPDDYGFVDIYVGDDSSLLGIETYVLLIEHICLSYLKYYPDDTEKIKKYLHKINERYTDFLKQGCPVRTAVSCPHYGH